MTKTIRRLASLFFIALLSASAAPAFEKGKTSLYYSVSMGGYTSSLFSAAEYADISASIEFASGRAFNPALSLHYLIPVNPFSVADSLAGFGVDLGLFYLLNHPMGWMSPRRTALAPSLGATLYLPLADPENLRYELSISPLRLFAGYGYFSFGAASLILDASFAVAGWGLRLFEFSYLIF